MAHYFEGPLHRHAYPGESLKYQAARKRKLEVAIDEDTEEIIEHSDSQQENSDDGNDPATKIDVRLGIPQRNLRHQHYLVLNTILHRCILEQDFPRASRALGMLLRFDINGRMCNIRKNNLWALAAEVIMRRDHATNSELASAHTFEDDSNNNNNNDNDNNNNNDNDNVGVDVEEQSDSTLSLDGFRQARQYLDRLILQYPFKPHSTGNDSAKQFYPVMFSLWILQIQSEAQRSERMLRLNHSPDSDDLSDQSILASHLRQVKRRELERATELRTAMDELMMLPPYDNDATLTAFRTQVQAWVDQLSNATSFQ